MALSLRDQVGNLLTEYSELTRKFFQSLTAIAENSTASDPDLLVKRIIEVDNRLQSALEQIEKHQARQRRITKVQDEIQWHQQALLDLVKQLNTAREGLEGDLTEASRELKAIRYAEQSNVDFKDILSYASKLAKYTSAPPGFDVSSTDVKVFEKPYPDEERMRRGLIYRQHAGGQQLAGQEDTFESSESEMSAEDEAANAGARPQAATEETPGDPFWILDLNPDLPS
ncbi:vitamin-D-receptor interacting mediator subunit 4-domain-containing protein [Zychaea mexicana]|uniref:vitamin-D-receptor interacting mediator subunit 4-domain-containing protein n=1 Tax=Zychaea mexicana TaxID=64656 RepID=UPI0022FE5F48|nr:vitamin-D-receptor interacting mediator subunit 4-domain-containing protein [Zychaea mexicana]KAI9495789.1 vitamin-D-receptor interacting mediator subunit 4-domain-containing protein [Zychaea mexicana]